ncbi:BamA/TamA family outer membrane protein [Microvirga tunisiensis]|uniref:BamA/TamA family outer membrane protein n=1 Tax=Pannonibacter tanglangensis TaxID=2750084 RepID=A0A7X5F231_9HYPH|nr:autotransporter assembly complex family protein [Pannonibacter sp. XCT-53]NBN78368.1 BamA/TamA family outer membrane protein [Pannonibacter sp. XCT-53]
MSGSEGPRLPAQRPTTGRVRALALPGAGLLALAVGLTALPGPATAFELFGYRLWGSASDAGAAADAFPYQPVLTLQGGDEPLKQRLTAASLLMSEATDAPSGESGLIARALNDFDRLVAQLYVEGRYGGTVDIRIAGLPLQTALQQGSLPGPRPVPVSIAISAGPMFTFGDVRIGTQGAAAGQLSTDPGFWGLAPGTLADSTKVLAAERQILTSLRARGYPKARIVTRDITADHANDHLDVTLVADAGAQARFGAVSVTGTSVTDPAFVVAQAMIPEGAVYDPEVLAKAQKRLNDLGIFASVTMVEADSVGPDGSLPVTIEVAERKRHVLGAGATWSSTEGGGLEAYWRRRNLFGQGELLSVEGSVGRLGNSSLTDMEYAARIAFEKPGVFGPLTSFSTSFSAKQEAPNAYTSRSATYDAYLKRTFTDTLSGRAGFETAFIDETDAYGKKTYLLGGLPADLTFDNRDDALNPSRGFLATAFAEPAYDIRNRNMMLFLRGSVSSYVALDEARRFVLAGRLSTGSIVGPQVDDIPAGRRFFAGGGGSIRGYAYRNVGPRRNGEVTGGRSVLELSGEVRVRLTETFGAVAFVDAGNVYKSSVPDFSRPFKIGVGAGLRYFTPIGPLRLDVAVPLSPEKGDPDFAIYLGLSQAF